MGNSSFSREAAMAASQNIKERDYWLNQLAGELEKSSFYYDEEKSRINQHTTKIKTFKIPQDIFSMLMKLSNQSHHRLHIILTAGVVLLLWKYTGGKDIIVGAPVYKQETEGRLINRVLALRNRVETNLTFKEFILQVAQTTFEANENQNYPIEILLHKLNLSFSENDFPLFDTAVLLENIHDKEYLKHIRLDMICSFLCTPDYIEGAWEYNTVLYDNAFLKRLINHFTNLLRQCLLDLELKISHLDILSAEERQELLIDFNKNKADFSRDKSIHRLIEEHAKKNPHRIALSFEKAHLTYRQLNERANQLARRLRYQGVNIDYPVGILLDRSPLMVESILAAWKAGGAYIPIETDYPVGRILEIMKDSGERVLLTRPGHVNPELEKSYQAKILYWDENPGDESDTLTNSDLDINMNSLAYVIYTSGSTGKPKGVMVEHIGMMNHIQAKINDLQLEAQSIIAQNASHTFDISVWQFFAALCLGGKTVIYPHEVILEPNKFITRIINDYVTILEVVPSYLTVMLETFVEHARVPLPIKYLVVTGEELKPHLVKKWFEIYPGLKIVNAYGPTEASDDITHYILDKAPDRVRIPIGKPVQNLNIYIVDENMKLCPIGVKGEICVSGVGVGRGYLNNPELTNSKFELPNKKTPHQQPHASIHHSSPHYSITPLPHSPIYLTGDLGCWLPDGSIDFFGRKDHQVKIRGFRIELEDIEHHLHQHPKVKEAVVIDRDTHQGDKYLCAYLVLAPGEEINTQEIKNHLQDYLPDYMIPASLIKLDKMPLTPNGKIDKNALAKMDPGKTGRDAPSITYITAAQLAQLTAPGGKLTEVSPGPTPISPKKNHGFTCFIIGDTTLPTTCAEILLRHGHTILGIITNEPGVKTWAEQHHIRHCPIKKTKMPSFLQQKSFDYLFSINNTYIIPEEILDLPRKSTINYHNGPLPRYAGCYAPYWAIINGEKSHGITWHLVDAGIDTGDILKQEQVEIAPGETGYSLNMKCYRAGARVFEKLIGELATRDQNPQKQINQKRTYFERYKRPDNGCIISWDREAHQISALIRGIDFGAHENPLGLPKIKLGNDFFIIPEIKVLETQTHLTPGTVIAIRPGAICVSTKTADIEINKISTIDGEEIPIDLLVEQRKLRPGYVFPGIEKDLAAQIHDNYVRLAKHEAFWVKRLGQWRGVKLMKTGNAKDAGSTAPKGKTMFSPPPLTDVKEDIFTRGDLLIAVFAAYLALRLRVPAFEIGYSEPSFPGRHQGQGGIFAQYVPLHVELEPLQDSLTFIRSMKKELTLIRKHQTYSRDILKRYPHLAATAKQPFTIGVTYVKPNDNPGEIDFPGIEQLNLVIWENSDQCMLVWSPEIMDEKSSRLWINGLLDFSRPIFAGLTRGMVRHLPTELDPRIKARPFHLEKINGLLIDSAEIEEILRQHEDIDEAMVVRRTGKNARTRLSAFVYSKKILNETQIKAHLARHLNPQMIPHDVVQLETLPRTPDGKIDRHKLETLEIEAVSPSHLQKPTNEIEEKLLETWKEVLGRDEIDIDDNFFMIGGDSIKTIQIASRIGRAGYKMEMKDIFQNPTISRLAPLIKKLDQAADQTLVTGVVPLTPIQKEFFQTITIDKHHFNQAIMLYSKQGFEEEAIKAVFLELQEHHDALRMTYKEENGKIIQINQGLDMPLDLQVFDYRQQSEAAAALEKKANQIQASINLNTGPLMKLGLFHLDDGDRLLIVIHHLIIDGVSWRILFEDIETLYQQYKKQEPLELPKKTDSFKTWAKKLSQYANSPAFLKEKDYWKGMESNQVEPIKKDFADENNTRKDMESVSFSLDEQETHQLLTRTNEAFGTEIKDILLTALGLGIKQTFGNEKVSITMEGHGREEILKDVDITRTVGWFTCVYPVLLDLSYERKGNNLARQIKEIKEHLHRVPKNGIGLGLLKYLTLNQNKSDITFPQKPQIIFNYLGQFDADIRQMSFGIAKESFGTTVSMNIKRGYQLDVSGMIADQQLVMSVAYNRKQYKKETIEALLIHYKNALNAIIAYCSTRGKGELTPVDFTHTGLSIETVDRLQKEYQIQDLFPLTPLQQGMLFHLLYEENSPAYFLQTFYRLRGELDISLVQKSLNELVKRHEPLRTLFVYKGVEQPIQVLLREREMEFHYKDLRRITESADKEQLIREIREKDRQNTFDLHRDNPTRITVLQLENQQFELIWTHHHILMDGWCRGILITEYLEIYNSFLEKRAYQLPPVPPYRLYIQWLEKHPGEQSREYWHQYLEGYEKTASIPRMKTIEKEPKETGIEEIFCQLDKEKHQGLVRLSGRSQVTLNTIFNTLWGILLGKYNDKQDVVYGTVVSGRPAEIPGVEAMVGLFINTVPVRITYHDHTTFNQLLQQVQQSALDSEPHHYYPLAKIQAETPLKQNLFDHLLAFENYPHAEQIEGIGDKIKKSNHTLKLELTDIQIFEQTHYDFILVIGGDPMIIKIQYNAHVYDREWAEAIVRHFNSIIKQTLENENIDINDIEIFYDFVEAKTNAPDAEYEDFDV